MITNPIPKLLLKFQAHLVPECSPDNSGSVLDVVDVHVLGGVPVEVSLHGRAGEKTLKRPHVLRLHHSTLSYLTQLEDGEGEKQRVSCIMTMHIHVHVHVQCTYDLNMYMTFAMSWVGSA